MTTELVFSQSLVNSIDQYLTAGVDNGFAGSVLIYHNDKILLNKGYGYADKDERTYNETSTVFDIGSNTKQFTGAAILRLEEMGLLGTQDSLHSYFEGLPDDKKQITIHNLLTHTSGFQESIGSDFDEISSEQFFKVVFSSSLVIPPGTSFNYSNIGYSILAKIIEIVSGMDYEVFLKEQLFDKAGMNQTGYLLPDWHDKNLGQGYNRNIIPQGTTISRYQEKSDVSWHLKGNGGINSTNEDLKKWITAVQSGAILSEASTKKWTQPYVRERENYYGYGWGVYNPEKGENIISHNGGNGAFANTIIWHKDTGDFIIFSTNTGSPSLERVPYELEKMIFSVDYSPPPIKKNPYFFVQFFIEENTPDQDHVLLSRLQNEYSEVISAPEFLNRLGYVNLRMDNQEWALSLFEINTTLFPDDGNAWDSLGEVYAINNQRAEAKRCFIKAIELGIEDSCGWCQGSINKLKDLVIQE